MKINIILTPIAEGRWRWATGRAGEVNSSGTADTQAAAMAAAEDAAQQHVAEARRAQLYLYDTDTHERIGYEE